MVGVEGLVGGGEGKDSSPFLVVCKMKMGRDNVDIRAARWRRRRGWRSSRRRWRWCRG